MLRANLEALGAASAPPWSARRRPALRATLEPGAFDLAFADPPYGQGLAAALVRAWLERPFARLLCVEHRRDDALPESPGARERRYGDTLLTFLPAPDA